MMEVDEVEKVISRDDVKELFFYRFYKFTVSAFTDAVFNVVMENWTKGVDTIASLADPTKSPERIADFKQNLVNSIFQKGKFDYVFRKWGDYVRGVLELPDHVTLPEDEVLLEASEMNDRDTILAEMEAKRTRIMDLQKQLANLNVELENAREMNDQADALLSTNQELREF